jgi:hypothetical protein
VPERFDIDIVMFFKGILVIEHKIDVNVIGPIFTDVDGGTWFQTTFFASAHEQTPRTNKEQETPCVCAKRIAWRNRRVFVYE